MLDDAAKNDGSVKEHSRSFPSTRWTLVVEAAGADSTRAADALGELYRRYRRPLLGLLRIKGTPIDECEDLLQGFFAQLISKAGLANVQREKGRFRSFLRASLTHFAIDQWRKKRSVSELPDGFDGIAEKLPGGVDQPDESFDRSWALELLRHAMNSLETEYTQRNRAEIFEVLHVYLAEKKPGLSHRDAAGRLGMSEGAVKTEVSRMRQRYREFIEDQIADTLCEPTLQAIEEEKRALFAALGGK